MRNRNIEPVPDNSIPFTSEEIQRQLDNSVEIPILEPLQTGTMWGLVSWPVLGETYYFKSYEDYRLYFIEGIITARQGDVILPVDKLYADKNNGYGLMPIKRFTFRWEPFTTPTIINPRLYVTIEGTKNLIARKLKISDSAEEMAPGIVNLQTMHFENISSRIIKDMRDVLVLALIDHENSN